MEGTGGVSIPFISGFSLNKTKKGLQYILYMSQSLLFQGFP